ncbi:LysE family translocator [Nonomuraea rubra]
MTAMAQVAAFGAIVLYGVMTPDPGLAVVVRRSAVSGRGPGMAAAAGIAVASFALVVAVADVGALLATSFTVVQVAGAAYLFYLGIRSLWAAWRGSEALRPGVPEPDGRRGSWAAFTEGLLATVLNPMAALFYAALVPQFLGGGADAPALGVVALAGTVAWFLLVANLVGLLHEVFAVPIVRRVVDGLAGVVLICFGVLLAFTRP